jgi:scyllo-inositol 2-dehydrogenase (NADP+)
MLRVIVIGLGVQGDKRCRVAGSDLVGSVDVANKEATWPRTEDVPLDSFDAAILCVPDEPKVELITYLLSHGKHVMVEKPLWTTDDSAFDRMEALARAKKLLCYTAYNHRFEPHFMRMHDLIRSGALGEIYRCHMFYGNGTARLVRESAWRDQGAGVLPDLGSHLLDTAAFWFGALGEEFHIVSANCFENRSPDHIVFASNTARPWLEFEMTLLNWRNHFTCNILAEKGTAHIESLCKWGPSIFTLRKRILPSGRPPEEAVTLVQPDPTWELEYAHFKDLIAQGAPADLGNDRWLNRVLRRLGDDAIRMTKA